MNFIIRVGFVFALRGKKIEKNITHYSISFNSRKCFEIIGGLWIYSFMNSRKSHLNSKQT